MLVKVEATEQNLDGTYMIIDLSGGTNATNFAISYLDDVPEGGWTDEYKTTKMVMMIGAIIFLLCSFMIDPP